MGRIFISAGHGGIEQGSRDPGAVVGNTTEAKEMILLRDLVVSELSKQGFEVLSVPDDRSMSETIQWINARTLKGDVALEIHADAFSNPDTRGAIVFYIANNTERNNQANLLLQALQDRVPQLPSQGTKPDTVTGVGRLSFCRDIIPPSLLMEVGFLSNEYDRFLIQNRRSDLALGIADGLAAWSRAISGLGTENGYPSIGIKLDNQTYPKKGIAINGNAYVPIEVLEKLVIRSDAANLRRKTYQGVVYVRAIELRDYNIAVSWDAVSSSVILRLLPIDPARILIMGNGRTPVEQLKRFLQANNQKGFDQFPDLSKLYQDEAAIEGVNHDIAFCQACVETNFLRFSGTLKPNYNNFGGLADLVGEVAVFESAKIGVRAHIQHLKAYAVNLKGKEPPFNTKTVDKRYKFCPGTAKTIENLSPWSADPQYTNNIVDVVRRLYDFK